MLPPKIDHPISLPDVAFPKAVWTIIFHSYRIQTVLTLRASSVFLENVLDSATELCAISHLRRVRGHLAMWVRLAAQWAQDRLPVQAVAFHGCVSGPASIGRSERPIWETAGDCPIDQHGFATLARHVRLEGAPSRIVNSETTTGSDWPCKSIRQLVIVPLPPDPSLNGWLAAFNRVDGGDLGWIEAGLLSLIATMLGADPDGPAAVQNARSLPLNLVGALSSAVDADDPYTRGHSKRVARIAVQLAQALGWEGDRLINVHIAGLLHDMGKVALDRQVLQKPSDLTDTEYEHVKSHPQLGYQILVDIAQLADVLPAVLHHHEQWDGGGYPHGLAGEQIPELARIIAVADAHDAMTSNRPYRCGLPLGRVHRIFQQGKGTHWEPRVVSAYFDVLDRLLLGAVL